MATTIFPYALTTVQKVKDFLSITDSSQDTLILQLINSATGYIENYVGGRRFMSTSYFEIKDAIKNSQKLFLNQRPCTAITLVEYRAGVPSSPTWITYNADSYIIYLSQGYIHFFGIFSNMPQAFRISYTAGYLIDWANEGTATHTLPAELSQVATEIVARKINTRKSQGISAESTEGQSVTYASSGDISKEQRDVLDGFKTYRMAV